jgi:hypothetical protein
VGKNRNHPFAGHDWCDKRNLNCLGCCFTGQRSWQDLGWLFKREAKEDVTESAGGGLRDRDVNPNLALHPRHFFPSHFIFLSPPWSESSVISQ